MTTTITSASPYLAPLLLGFSAALAAGNWYLRPERANSWAIALVFLASLALILWTAIRRAPTAAAVRHSVDATGTEREPKEVARRRTGGPAGLLDATGTERERVEVARRGAGSPADPITVRSAIVWATLIIAVSLAVKLVQALDAIDDPDASKRLTMVALGAFFVFTGNAMPKMLTPLSVLRCDGARTQAIQRFAGWTFVLTGLAFATAWLVLPPDVAEPVSVGFIVCAGLAVTTQVIRVRRIPRSV
jgi:hypothetical protein